MQYIQYTHTYIYIFMYAYFYKIKQKLMLVFQEPVGLDAKKDTPAMTSAASFNNSGRYSSTDIKGLAGGTTSVIFEGELESTNILKLFSFRQYHCNNV